MTAEKGMYDINQVRALAVLVNHFPRPSVLSYSYSGRPYEYESRHLLDELLYEQNQMLIKSIKFQHNNIINIDNTEIWYCLSTGQVLNAKELQQRNVVDEYLRRAIALQKTYRNYLGPSYNTLF